MGLEAIGRTASRRRQSCGCRDTGRQTASFDHHLSTDDSVYRNNTEIDQLHIELHAVNYTAHQITLCLKANTVVSLSYKVWTTLNVLYNTRGMHCREWNQCVKVIDGFFVKKQMDLVDRDTYEHLRIQRIICQFTFVEWQFNRLDVAMEARNTI